MDMPKRMASIDLLKCIAIFTIPAQHFFSLHSQFRQTTFSGFPMFFQGVGMELFLIGVPLFIAITGFLSRQTRPTLSYYRKSLRVIVPYIVISIVYILFRTIRNHEAITFLDGLLMILGFTAIPYAWYVEMWIGLYLLAPFLNILADGISSRRDSIILIATLYVMSYLAATLNREGYHLLPGYWVNISPLACYFFGAHLRRFGCGVPRKRLVLFILFAIMVEPTVNLLFFRGQVYRFVLGIYLFIVPAMAALFALLYQWETEKKWLGKALALVSGLTREMYLWCALFDMILYPFFMQWFTSQEQFGLFFFAIIPIELAGTFCLAWITKKLLQVTRIDRLWKGRTTAPSTATS